MTTVQALFQKPLIWLEKKPQLLVRLVIVGVVLSVSMYMAYRAARVSKLELTFYHPVPVMIVAIVAAFWFLRYPKVGLLVFLPSLTFVTVDVGTGSDTRIGAPVLLLGLLIGLWFFDMFARKRSVKIFPSKALPAALAFLMASIVSFAIGQLPFFAFASPAPIRAQLGQLAIFFFSFLLSFIVADQISDLIWLKRFTRIFILVAFFAIIGDALPFIGNITDRFFYYSAKGSLFWTWLTALVFSQAVLNQRLGRIRRLLLAAILIVIFYISFIANRAWSSGWLPPFIAVGVILWFGVPRARKPLLFLSFIVAAVFASKVYNLVMVGDNQYSLSTRLAAWQLIGEMVRVDPIFGLGPANYYWYTPLFPILGYRVVFNSHNNYVDLIAQTGLVGTVCFIWFSFVVIRLALRLRDHMPDPFARAYVYGVLGGWAGTLVAAALGDWVLPFVYNIGYAGLHASLIGWFFLGGLLVLEKLDRRSQGGEMVVQSGTMNAESQVI